MARVLSLSRSRERPGTGLVVASVAVAAVFAGPPAYLLLRATTLGDVWFHLSSPQARELLGATLVLATAVSAAAAVVGTGLAWLVTRTDLPLRKLWGVLAPLPLVFPSFVGAAALLAAFDRGGMISELIPSLADRLPEVEGFRGAWLVLTLFTYPYVYLPVAARLSSLPPSLEESARLLGRGPWSVFRTVVVPQTSGAIWAGSLLVFLYTVSDYGAVAALKYRTLSVEIFEDRLFNQPKAFALAVLLAGMAFTLVVAERAVGRRRSRIEVVRARQPLQLRLGHWRWPALAATLLVVGNALLGPLTVLGFWAWRGITGSGARSTIEFAELARPAANTATIGVVAAVITVALVLPVAYLTARHRTRIGGAANAVVVSGFALPGLLVALALAFWSLEFPLVGSLYQTMWLLLVAYAVHFGAQAMRSAQVAVAAVPNRLTDAARMLGAGRWRRFRTIELPLMIPGLVAGGGLVLLSVMKELPATLMLSPIGTETLAVHIWSARETSKWAETGVASLALVAMSGVLTWLLVARRVERFD